MFMKYIILIVSVCLLCQNFYTTGNEFVIHREEKKEIWLSPMTKAPAPAEMYKGQSDNTNNATKKFDYTAIADRLRMGQLE